MKKSIFTLFVLVFMLSYTEEAATTQKSLPAKTTRQAKPVVPSKAVKEENMNKPVTTKTTIRLKISKNIPAIKNGDVTVTVYEYDPFLADYPADEVYYKDYSVKHIGGKADTTKVFTFNVKKSKGKKYYAVVEVIDNRSLEVYRAKPTKDDLGKILEPDMASQVFLVEAE